MNIDKIKEDLDLALDVLVVAEDRDPYNQSIITAKSKVLAALSELQSEETTYWNSPANWTPGQTVIRLSGSTKIDVNNCGIFMGGSSIFTFHEKRIFERACISQYIFVCNLPGTLGVPTQPIQTACADSIQVGDVFRDTEGRIRIVGEIHGDNYRYHFWTSTGEVCHFSGCSKACFKEKCGKKIGHIPLK